MNEDAFYQRLGTVIAHGRDADPELFEELQHPSPETQRLLDDFTRDLREAVAAFNDDTDRWLADVLPAIRELADDDASDSASPTDSADSPIQPSAQDDGEMLPSRNRRWVSLRLAIAASVLFCVGGFVLGRISSSRQPVTHDAFEAGWFDVTNWRFPPDGTPPEVPPNRRIAVDTEGGYLVLRNRGALVSAKEFEAPIEIEFDWRWSNLAETPLYADTLTIVPRTKGELQRMKPWEATDGARVVLNAMSGTVEIGDYNVKAESQRGAVKFAANQWYRVRIVDDGTRIDVFVRPRDDKPEGDLPPIVQLTYSKLPTGNRVAIYNREYLAGTNHESHLDNIVIHARLIATRK